jgi:chaperonin GroES
MSEGTADVEDDGYRTYQGSAPDFTVKKGHAAPLNTTGIFPTEHKVLVEQKAAEEVTAGGIIIPSSTKDSLQYAEIEGRIIAVSRLAFNYATDEEWGGDKPKAGDRIIIAKYSGVRVKGVDGKEYLLTNDKDITAVRKD